MYTQSIYLHFSSIVGLVVAAFASFVIGATSAVAQPTEIRTAVHYRPISVQPDSAQLLELDTAQRSQSRYLSVARYLTLAPRRVRLREVRTFYLARSFTSEHAQVQTIEFDAAREQIIVQQAIVVTAKGERQSLPASAISQQRNDPQMNGPTDQALVRFDNLEPGGQLILDYVKELQLSDSDTAWSLEFAIEHHVPVDEWSIVAIWEQGQAPKIAYDKQQVSCQQLEISVSCKALQPNATSATLKDSSPAVMLLGAP